MSRPEWALALTAFAMGFGIAASTLIPVRAAVSPGGLGPNLRAPGALMAPQNLPLEMIGTGSTSLQGIGSVIQFPSLSSLTYKPALGPDPSGVFVPSLFNFQMPAWTPASNPVVTDEFMKMAEANFNATPPDFSRPSSLTLR